MHQFIKLHSHPLLRRECRAKKKTLDALKKKLSKKKIQQPL